MVACAQATHNGNPADDSPRDVGWVNGYHGLARAFVRVSMDAATPHWHRSRMLEIDVESGRDGSVSIAGAAAATAGDIVLSLQDGSKLEMRSVPEFDRNLNFAMSQPAEDAVEASQYPDSPAKEFIAKVESGEEPAAVLPPYDPAAETSTA